MSSQAFRPFRPQDRKGLLHFPCQKKKQNLGAAGGASCVVLSVIQVLFRNGMETQRMIC